VRVPTHAIKDGQIVLNVAVRAVADLELGNDRVRFNARFGGVSQQVDVPVSAVLAIYAQENGQGMMFPVEAQDDAPPPEPPVEPDKPVRKGPGLRIVK
jgi:stringent starvation protein B